MQQQLVTLYFFLRSIVFLGFQFTNDWLVEIAYNLFGTCALANNSNCMVGHKSTQHRKSHSIKWSDIHVLTSQQNRENKNSGKLYMMLISL